MHVFEDKSYPKCGSCLILKAAICIKEWRSFLSENIKFEFLDFRNAERVRKYFNNFSG